MIIKNVMKTGRPTRPVIRYPGNDYLNALGMKVPRPTGSFEILSSGRDFTEIVK